MMNDTWWPLSASICWIAIRRPLRFDEWPEEVAPARIGPPRQLADDHASLPHDVRNVLARADDGVLEGISELARELWAAGASGEVSLRGRGPWILRDAAAAGFLSEAQAADDELRTIRSGYFTLPSISSASIAWERLGPSEEARDPGSFERWTDVEVSAADLRRCWPQIATEPSPEAAGSKVTPVEWMRANLGSPEKYKALIARCVKEVGCLRDQAAAAKKEAQGGPRQGRRKLPENS